MILNDITGSNSLFKGVSKADIFEFTSIDIGSNHDDYFSNYTGADFQGNASNRNYTKLDLSGVTAAAKTYVRIGRRAQYPIGHIVPPSSDGISIFYFIFTAQTTGFYQQNLVWSFAGTSGINDVVSCSDMTNSSANQEKYRATDGAGQAGGIYFFDENSDRFRGFAYGKSCLVGSDHGSTNAATGIFYEMSHQVSQDVVYKFMCKDGRWFLMETTHTPTGASQDTHRTDVGASSGFGVNVLKAKQIIQGESALLSSFTGTSATTGSTTTPQFHLNKGGSLSKDLGISDSGRNYDRFKILDGDDWDTTPTTALSSRDGDLYIKFQNAADAFYLTSNFNYDLYNFENEYHSSRLRHSINWASGSDNQYLTWGDENDVDAIIMQPNQGSLSITGGLGVGTTGVTTAGLIRATNDVVAFYSSDKRLKDNLIKIGNPLDKISQLNGYEFDWIAKEGIHENEGHDVGVIAQEVEKVIPEIVQTRDNGYKAVKYEKIVPLLIESIKEQQEQIDELKKEVEELKNGTN